MMGTRRFRWLSVTLFVVVMVVPLLGAAGWGATLAPVTTPSFVDSGQALGSSASRDVALADVDGDGDLDALVGHADAPLTLWLNQGGLQGGTAGVFVDSGQDLGGFGSSAVVLTDVDGDGDADAVVIRTESTDALQIYRNLGPAAPGTFVDSGQTITGLVNGVAAGDVDGDGSVDLLVTAHLQGNQVWLNDGTGAFADSGQRLGDGASTSAALADLDGDGDLDAYVGNTLNSGVAGNTVWINQGGSQGGTPGIFTDSEQRLGNGNTAAVALGDMDGDGDVDALAFNIGQDRLWLNNGSGLFSDSGQALDAALSFAGALADLDGDGDLDAFVANVGGNTVWLNDGAGTLADSGQFLGSADSYGVATGDVDGDGRVDAFVANSGADAVWLNRPAGPTEGADVQVILPPSRYIETSLTYCLLAGVNFEVSVHNAGPETASNVTVHAEAGHFDILSSSPSHNFGTLQPGESASIQLYEVPVRSSSGSETIVCTATAQVRVTADQADPVPANSSGQVNLLFYNCDLLSCGLGTFFCEEIKPARAAGGGLQLPGLQQVQETALDLIVYYYVRDGVLAESSDGRRYIDLYYTHDPEIKALLAADETLKAEARAALGLWEPHLWALVLGKGETATITAAQVAAVDEFLTNLAAVASPELQQAIAAERQRLPAPEAFVGMTVAEARGATVGYGVLLPVMVRD